MKCPARFAIYYGHGGWSPFAVWPDDKPSHLACDLAEGHKGGHHDPVHGEWEFVANAEGPPIADHVNCRCELVEVGGLATVDDRTIPPWWIAQRCDEVFGPTSPSLFFPVLR